CVAKIDVRQGRTAKPIGRKEQEPKGLNVRAKGKIQKGVGDLKETVSDLKQSEGQWRRRPLRISGCLASSIPSLRRWGRVTKKRRPRQSNCRGQVAINHSCLKAAASCPPTIRIPWLSSDHAVRLRSQSSWRETASPRLRPYRARQRWL